jgi:hypothetical protein
MAEGIGRELKPTKLNIKPGSEINPAPVTKPDDFGQVYSAAKDYAGGNVPSAEESNRAHFNSDADSSQQSLHHTLGPGRNQSSPGNHIHDGVTSPKIGKLEMDPVNLGKTRAEWTIPAAPTVNDLVTLLSKFVNFRQV